MGLQGDVVTLTGRTPRTRQVRQGHLFEEAALGIDHHVRTPTTFTSATMRMPERWSAARWRSTYQSKSSRTCALPVTRPTPCAGEPGTGHELAGFPPQLRVIGCG